HPTRAPGPHSKEARTIHNEQNGSQFAGRNAGIPSRKPAAMPIQKTPGNPRSPADLTKTPRKSRKIPRFGRSLLENGRSGNRRFQICQESTRFGVFELGRSISISNLYTNPPAEIAYSKPLSPYKHQARPNRHTPQPAFPAGARPGKSAEVVACS